MNERSDEKPGGPVRRKSTRTDWKPVIDLWGDLTSKDQSVNPSAIQELLVKLVQYVMAHHKLIGGAFSIKARRLEELVDPTLRAASTGAPIPCPPAFRPSEAPAATSSSVETVPAVEPAAPPRSTRDVPPTLPATIEASAPSRQPVAPDNGDNISRLDHSLKELTDQVKLRLTRLESMVKQAGADTEGRRTLSQEVKEAVGRAFEDSALERTARSAQSLGPRMQDLEQRLQALGATVKEQFASVKAQGEHASAECQQRLEKEADSMREAVGKLDRGLNERLSSKIDLQDVQQVLVIRQHIDEAVRSEVIRNVSRGLFHPLKDLEQALSDKNLLAASDAYQQLTAAYEAAGLVLDPARL